MKRRIAQIGCLLLLMMTTIALGSCNNEDDVTEIFTGKTWKMSRLTTEDSSQQFFIQLGTQSMNAFREENTYTVVFEGAELNGELTGTEITVKGVSSTATGSWSADGKSGACSFNLKVSGSESDQLAREFMQGMQKVYKYEGDVNNLTLYYKDGQTTRIIGFAKK